MPFRTRDFLLFLLVVIFLVMAIATTISRDVSRGTTASTIDFPKTTESVTYEAVLTESPPDERERRLDTLRKKIAKLGTVETISAPTVDDMASEELSDNGDVVTIGDVDYCEDYASVTTSWLPDDLNFEIVEGARIIYRESSAVIGTSSVLRSENTVLQLPLRSAPISVKSCIGQDVAGIALDGSLIRNDEYGLYGIFGSETHLGYALDGFPIYGSGGDLQTDSCGGSVVSGEYRYYLSPEREGVLGCYSGVPVRI